MSTVTVSRLGQVNAAGDAKALFLKVFAGEVLTSFEQTNVMSDKHMIRTITSGKSAQFPVMGRASASYHTPGAEIQGTARKHAERVISIDDLLISDSFIANIDEAMNHYDVRSVYSTESGRELAKQYDQHVLQVGVLAARASATITGEAGQYGGTVIYNGPFGGPATSDFLTSGDDLADAIFEAAQTMDEKDVPEEDRFVFVRPQQFYLLAKSTKVLNRDWGGKGSYADGTVISVAGVTIVKTNNLPSTNITTGTEAGTDNKYAGDFSNTVALVMHPSAVGTVKLLDLAMESEYLIKNQGTLMVAKYALGHGILRPEAAVEIRNELAPS